MKKILPILIIGVIACLFTGALISKRLRERVILNEGYVNGNTAGNLYNSGLFCESNGEIFFSNPDDSGRLYRMDSDGKNVKKLNNDAATYINADDHYIYYARNNKKNGTSSSFFSFYNNSLCRVPRSGGSPYILDRNACMYVSLIGNELYYFSYTNEDATTLYTVRINGGKPKQVSKNPLFPCSALGQYFYYNGVKTDGNLYRYDAATGQSQLMYECSCYKPTAISANDVYYMDAERDCALMHTNTVSGNPTAITEEPVDCYNVYGSYIYYQKNSKTEPMLCRVKNDGSEFSILAYGDYTNIHVTTYYVFFSDFHTGAVFYTSTTNPGEPQPFHPGVDQ